MLPSKIVCVGRNYLAHARELGNAMPERPLLFLKPPSTLIGPGEAILLPAQSTRVEHEAEIAVVLGQRLRNVSAEEAEAGIGGIACANDVTARDLQAVDGQWTRAKGFDTFCPVGPVHSGCDWRDLEIICRVNGVVTQHGHSADMAYSIPVLLAYISTIMTLEPGDLVLTGTPAGVSPLVEGDMVEVEIPGLGALQNPVRNAPR